MAINLDTVLRKVGIGSNPAQTGVTPAPKLPKEALGKPTVVDLTPPANTTIKPTTIPASANAPAPTATAATPTPTATGPKFTRPPTQADLFPEGQKYNYNGVKNTTVNNAAPNSGGARPSINPNQMEMRLPQGNTATGKIQQPLELQGAAEKAGQRMGPMDNVTAAERLNPKAFAPKTVMGVTKNVTSKALGKINTGLNAVQAGDDLGMIWSHPNADVVQKLGASGEALGNVAGGYLVDAAGKVKKSLGIGGTLLNASSGLRPVTAISHLFSDKSGLESLSESHPANNIPENTPMKLSKPVAGEATIQPMKPLINTAATPPVVAEKASIGETPVAASNAKYLAALNENGTGNAAGRKEYEAQANKSIDTSSYGGFFNSISDRKRAQRGIEELDKREAIDSQKMLGLGQLSVSEQAGIRADAQNKATNDRNARLDLRQTNMDTASALQQAHENDDKKRLERFTKSQKDSKTGLISDYVDRAAMTDMQATADTNHLVGIGADNQDVQDVTKNEGFQYNPDGTPVSSITAGEATIGDALASDKVNIWDAIWNKPVLRQNGNAVSVEKANTDDETNFFNSKARNTNNRARKLLAKMHADLTEAQKKKISH